MLMIVIFVNLCFIYFTFVLFNVCKFWGRVLCCTFVVVPFFLFTLNDDVFVLNQPKCQHERKTVKLVSVEERREQASGIITC